VKKRRNKAKTGMIFESYLFFIVFGRIMSRGKNYLEGKANKQPREDWRERTKGFPLRGSCRFSD
jgi:hypothetical protein